MKTRGRTLEDAEVGQRTISLCHLAYISIQRGGATLRWDPVKERFPDDEAANTLSDRPRAARTLEPGDIMTRRAAILGFVLLLVAAAAHAQAPNTLSPAERAAGWTLLFDGKTTAGWRGFQKPAFPAAGWAVEDGTPEVPRPEGRRHSHDGDVH